jgi:hypothetical protein
MLPTNQASRTRNAVRAAAAAVQGPELHPVVTDSGFSARVSMLWRNGVSGFVNVSLVEGLRHVRNRGVAAGVRMEF